MRRFVQGESKQKNKKPSKSETSKLEAYRDFLVSVKYLSKTELQEAESDFSTAYALLEFSKSGWAALSNNPGLHDLAQRLVGVHRYERKITEHVLNIDVAQDEQLLFISESENVYDDPRHLPFSQWRQAERRYNFRYCRRLAGWGVLWGQNQVYMFLKCQDNEQEHHAYLAVDFRNPDKPNQILLTR